MILSNINIVVTSLYQTAAYLDPGSGSYIIQLIIAGFMGGLFMLGVYWKKVKSFVKGLFSGRTHSEKDG